MKDGHQEPVRVRYNTRRLRGIRKIQWESPDPDQEYSISQQQEHNTRDKGTAAFGWEPQPHLEGATAKRNFQLQLTTTLNTGMGDDTDTDTHPVYSDVDH